MANLEINEVRSVRYVGGVQTFEIFVTCTGKGDLPTTGIFVHKILDTRDPLQDEFQRVAAVADITTFQSDRDEANRIHDQYWLSSTVKLTYTDIDIANQAVRILSDRVNTLATEWDVYDTSFNTTGTDYLFPSGDPTYIAEVKADYATKVAAYDTAEAAQTAATLAYNTAVSDLGAANDEVTAWTDQLNKIAGGVGGETGLNTYLSFASTKFNALKDDSNTMSAALDSFLNNLNKIILSVNSGSYLTPLVLEASGYSTPGPGDIGELVSITSPAPGATGALIYFQDDIRTWWVDNVTGGSFAPEQVIETPGGGAGTIDLVGSTSPVPYYSLVTIIRAAQSSFATKLTQAELDSDAIEAGVTYGAGVESATRGTLTDKNTAAQIAQDAVNTAKLAQLDATAALNSAYNDVIDAYDKVKEVCPDWSPVPPLPPKP